MKTIYVDYETLDKAARTLCETMLDICDRLQTYPEYLADYSYADWDANISAETRDRVFEALTEGLSFDDVDSMLNTEGYVVCTAWDGLAYDIWSAYDLWMCIIDVAYEALPYIDE